MSIFTDVLEISYKDSRIFNKNGNITKINKDNIIYSNELVKDLKILSKCNSLESIDYNIRKLEREMITKKMALRFSTNNLKIEDRMLGFSMEDAKGFVNNIKQKIKALCNKIISFIMSIIDKMTFHVQKISRKYYSHMYKSFNATYFTNMEATIKVIPFNFNESSSGVKVQARFILSDLIKHDQIPLKQIRNDVQKEKLTDEALTIKPEDVRRKIFQFFFGKDEFPEKIETTVGEYLHCKKGERPKLLNLLSPEYMKWDEEDINLLKDTIKSAKESGNSDKNPEIVQKRLNNLTVISKFTYSIWTVRHQMIRSVFKAINAGLTKGKMPDTFDFNK